MNPHTKIDTGRMTSKGQVLIPKAVRDATGLKPKLVPADRSRFSREHVGSEYIGWLLFQTIYDQLAKTQPDMFE